LNVFPVGGESGTQAWSPCTAKAESNWKVSESLFSDLLVEKNNKMFEGKDRSPELLTDLPG
jgi:hypothetical protein